MTMFSSHAPFSDDHEPYENFHGARSAYPSTPGFCSECETTYKPRPWMVLPQNNPSNPILLDVRRYRRERLGMNNPKGWDHVLRKFEHAVHTSYPWSDATPFHVDHARRVLTRLAALQEVSS